MFCRHVRLLIWVVAAAVLGCVPHVDVNRTPCPCGEGFTCCPTLSLCLAEQQDCPDKYPLSSGKNCDGDNDCPHGEACASWSNANAQDQGPRQCRRLCSDAFSCSEGETCTYTLHDGQTIQRLQVGQLCLEDRPSDPCAHWPRCTGCDGTEPGATTCINHDLYGCLVGVHGECGLTCTLQQMGSCTTTAAQLCLDHSCEDCISQYGDAPFCHDNDVTTCGHLTPPEPGPDCSVLCGKYPVKVCANGCHLVNGAATCLE